VIIDLRTPDETGEVRRIGRMKRAEPNFRQARWGGLGDRSNGDVALQAKARLFPKDNRAKNDPRVRSGSRFAGGNQFIPFDVDWLSGSKVQREIGRSGTCAYSQPILALCRRRSP
jgi:hypothetical protein